MRHCLRWVVSAIGASLLLAACGSSSSSSSSSTAAPASAGQSSTSGIASASVKTASDAALGGTVLVDSQGMTLYRLTGEQNGKFICTSSGCLGVWHPLTASGGVPSGSVASLGVVTRPDGTKQVTFKGEPLYTFANDQKPGDTKGQGIKDVGTWTAVQASARATSAPATSTPKPPASSSGGGYGY